MATQEADDLAVARLKADAALAALGGRVWADEAPTGAELPYAVVSLAGQTPAYESGLASSGGPAGLDEAELRVSIFASGRAQAKSLRRLAETSLLAAGIGLYLRRSNHLVELDPGKSPAAGDVWHALTSFRAILELE